MNPLESLTTETEQKNHEQKGTQTAPEPQTVKPSREPEIRQESHSLSSNPGNDAAFEPAALAQPLTGELSYTCLLIPRFHDHYLTGDITTSLVEWMRQICISYGWRLDAIVIRPGYLQWVMTVPLNANPAQFMRTTRQLTSQKIFDEFPRYRQKNLSGQFWAPGNLVLPGNQLLTLENINSFILQIRRQQGIA